MSSESSDLKKQVNIYLGNLISKFIRNNNRNENGEKYSHLEFFDKIKKEVLGGNDSVSSEENYNNYIQILKDLYITEKIKNYVNEDSVYNRIYHDFKDYPVDELEKKKMENEMRDLTKQLYWLDKEFKLTNPRFHKDLYLDEININFLANDILNQLEKRVMNNQFSKTKQINKVLEFYESMLYSIHSLAVNNGIENTFSFVWRAPRDNSEITFFGPKYLYKERHDLYKKMLNEEEKRVNKEENLLNIIKENNDEKRIPDIMPKINNSFGILKAIFIENQNDTFSTTRNDMLEFNDGKIVINGETVYNKFEESKDNYEIQEMQDDDKTQETSEDTILFRNKLDVSKKPSEKEDYIREIIRIHPILVFKYLYNIITKANKKKLNVYITNIKNTIKTCVVERVIKILNEHNRTDTKSNIEILLEHYLKEYFKTTGTTNKIKQERLLKYLFEEEYYNFCEKLKFSYLNKEYRLEKPRPVIYKKKPGLPELPINVIRKIVSFEGGKKKPKKIKKSKKISKTNSKKISKKSKKYSK
tara:strand:+ start:5526 stop:7115 length:1590 start_codon:yes stop_codon:yes gene_type:complete